MNKGIKHISGAENIDSSLLRQTFCQTSDPFVIPFVDIACAQEKFDREISPHYSSCSVPSIHSRHSLNDGRSEQKTPRLSEFMSFRDKFAGTCVTAKSFRLSF